MLTKFLVKLGLHNLLLIFGLLGLAGTGLDFWNTVSFLKSSERVKGVVTKVEMSDGAGESTMSFHPVFNFKTKASQEVTCTCVSYGSSSPDYAVGEKATIAYDPADPSKAFVISYFNLFGLTSILFSISLALIIGGGGYYLAKPFLKLDVTKITA